MIWPPEVHTRAGYLEKKPLCGFASARCATLVRGKNITIVQVGRGGSLISTLYPDVMRGRIVSQSAYRELHILAGRRLQTYRSYLHGRWRYISLISITTSSSGIIWQPAGLREQFDRSEPPWYPTC